MTALTEPNSTEEAKAASDLRRGGLVAIVASLLALAVPAALLLLARSHLEGLSLSSTTVARGVALSVVGGSVLALLALLLYRRAFLHLRHVDRRIRPSAALCLVGSVGTLALLFAAAYLAGGSASITGCAQGPADHALACLRSHDATAGYVAIAAFWFVWIGAAGVASGLMVAGRSFRRASLSAGGIVYGLLVADLAVPFAGLLVRLPSTPYALGGAPVAAVLAGALVYVGARGPLRRGD